MRAAAGPREAGTLRQHWPLAVLCLVAVALAVWAHLALLPTYSWNRDEPVYLWQVEVLRSGHLTAPDGGFPDIFRPWLTAADGGRIYSQYTLGWPAVLLGADVLFGTHAAALALGALLAVAGTYALAWELLRDRAIAIVAGAVFVASPIVAVQAGAYLSYLFTLGLGLLFTTTLLSAVRLDRPRRAGAAGLLLGCVVLTRPFDAVLWGAAPIAYLLITNRRSIGRLVRPGAWLSAGALPFVVATLAYNHRVTGSATTFPITVADPLDTFGFGTRRLMPGFERVRYDPWKAVVSSGKNGLLLPLFLAGSYLSPFVIAWSLWVRRRERSTLALLLVALTFPAGYFFFWGMHVSSLTARFSGPIYYIPAYAPLSVLLGAAIVGTWRRRRQLGIALVALLLLATTPAAVSRLGVNQRISEAQRPWLDAARSVEGPALVFVADSGPYLLHLNPFAANRPDLKGDVLYAADGGVRNLDVLLAHRDREPYVELASLVPDELQPRERPHPLSISVIRLRTLEADEVELGLQLVPPPGHLVAALQLESPAGTQTNTRTGAGTAYWSLGAADVPEGLGTVTVTVGFGADEEQARNRPFARHQIHYRSDGEILTILLPTAVSRAYDGEHGLAWQRVSKLPEANLEITPRR